ncbi:putative monooxygenase [Aspergillus fischeri NRRL 181]|uniref:Uncharacterized protein n=1 Tax=Neosartorya fischeri (strain ATCC 1020 / DSM 3700 / CBS 544.65 / FGSC A1164 / JCM 1740 / NRRL 181 / WB 181) TaxID=331117 RepID=A1DBQ3_NEOFI|nr:uncharacterized protein NFIA_099270 [Aspergillus fischeri NRRL 181]EAW20293.1 predicted protein [Aspergillus fischeri NRRL 181]
MTALSKARAKLSCDEYTVGWLCVLDYEYDVSTALLDEEHDTPFKPHDDPSSYTVGRIGGHNVVIAKCTRAGTTNASTAVTHMLRTFDKIRFGLMVGIGGGAADAPGSHDPRRSTTDILLGDVVVSKPEGNHGGILQYDKGRRGPGKFEIESHLNSPGNLLISATDKLSRDHRFKRGNMAGYIEEAQLKLEALGMSHFSFPGRHHDLLFATRYNHPNKTENDCRNCDRAEVVRTSVPRNDPVVHYGLIASGNTVVRDAHMRDTMRREHKVVCFDMEAAGLMNNFPCLVIRGISDYADTHKNDLWQPYAALTAAAYAKDLLALIQPQEIVALDKLTDRLDQINGVLDSSYRKKILDWITPLDFHDEQQRVYVDSVPTGEWLINSDVFEYWADGARCQLRCHGEAGTGKSYLCALIVHHLRLDRPLSPVIHISLSDHEDSQKLQTGVNLLGSMVKQLLLFNTTPENPCKIPTTLRNAYESHCRSETILKQTFEALLDEHKRTYLVIDGLDLCSKDALTILKAYPLELISQDSHVFPPFGGQGVACGVQDAVGLAWRLAILTKVDSLAHSRTLRESLLQAWADERRMGTDNSARLTWQNGELCNKEGSWSLSIQLACLNIVQGFLGALGIRLGPFGADSQGYRGCVGGGFTTEHGGGIKLGQVYVQIRLPDSPILRVELSDQALRRVPTILTLLVVAPMQCPEMEQELDGLLQVLQQSGIDPSVLSEQSIVQFDSSNSLDHLSDASRWPVCRVAPADLLIGYPVRPGYNSNQFMRRLGDTRARYVILRPDNIVIAMSRDLSGLKNSLDALEKTLT